MVRVLVEFSWLKRAPGARGRRRRAARALLSELLQPKKVIFYAGFLVRLYHMNTPHRPTEADFRSTVPFSRTGMRLFNGLGCSVSCSTQATSFRKATWSSPCLGLRAAVGGLLEHVLEIGAPREPPWRCRAASDGASWLDCALHVGVMSFAVNILAPFGAVSRTSRTARRMARDLLCAALSLPGWTMTSNDRRITW